MARIVLKELRATGQRPRVTEKELARRIARGDRQGTEAARIVRRWADRIAAERRDYARVSWPAAIAEHRTPTIDDLGDILEE